MNSDEIGRCTLILNVEQAPSWGSEQSEHDEEGEEMNTFVRFWYDPRKDI